MNITIISFLILNFLLLVGFWRQQAFYFTIFLLILYILMIGSPASAVRAGVMAGLFLLAQHLGRMSVAQRAVVFAAAFMLFLNPLLLRLDVGFQLSFLAIMGIIYLQPTFSDFLKKIPNFQFFPLRTTLSATLSAQFFTLPILIYNFGYIPLISPITNILIVPFLAPITILIFVFGLSGTIFSLLGYIFSFPTWLSLTYITKIIDFFSKISFTSLTFERVSWIWLIISYLILGFLTWRLQESQKLKFLKY
jgi:competence protein ComEC